MNIKLRLSVFFFVALIYNLQAQTVRYVKQGGTGNGSSWALASGDLQAMINASTAGNEVWVAAGTYQPASGQSYSMKEGVKIYGGFPAMNTLGMAQRNWAANPTILQGNNNSVIANDNNGLTTAALIDGFTITGGNANGGGFYNVNSSPTISNVIIKGNIAGYTGGGVYNYSSSPLFKNVIITNNTAEFGGGICNYNSSSVMTNVTIAGNTAANGGGVYSYGGSSLIVQNSIIYDNSTGVGNYDSTIQASYSLIQASGGSTAWNTWIGINAGYNIDLNPLFTNPESGDYTLQSGSPAINAGNNAYFINAVDSKDLASKPRMFNSIIDMGAYENQDPIHVRYVKQGGIGNGYSWANASGNLQAMVNESVPGNQVWVSAGTYQLASGQSFSMKEGVKIYGGFPNTGNPGLSDRNLIGNVTILQGNNSRVINNDNNGLTNAAVLDGFTITGGNIANLGGGGIYNYASSPTLTNATISGNNAIQGGGIYNFNSSPILANVIISGNTANTYGGGIFNSYNSSPTLTNVTVSGNTSGSTGGGIYNYSSSAPRIRNSILYNNSSGIYNENSTPTIVNSLVQGMAADVANHNINGSTDPQFVAMPSPGLNSGGDYRLQIGSPVINMGSNSFFMAGQIPDLSAITKDLAGNPRVFEDIVDMGAYESQNPILSIRYVRQGFTGNGYSWADASGDLQAVINQSAVDKQVWVAAGTYQRASGQSFSMKEGVKIYGGFPNTGNPGLSDRNLAENVTLLQGNNSRVITNGNNGLTNAAILDGFTITGGSNVLQGAGMYNVNAHPLVRNCIFKDGTATDWGGGIYDEGTGGSTKVYNTLFYNNTASGGAVFANNSAINFINCTFAGNTGGNGGALHPYNGSTVLLQNCILWGNTATTPGGGTQIHSSLNAYATIQNCIIQDASAGSGIAGQISPTGIIIGDPQFANAGQGDYRILSGSPAVDAGNTNAFSDAASATDTAGSPRLNGNSIDVGAYENQGIIDCIAPTTWNGSTWSNRAPSTIEYSATITGNLTSSGNLTACSLTVSSGNVTVNPGHNFIIKGAVNVTGGAGLTFENNAHLVQTDNVANSGSIIYKRNSNPLHYLDYTIWSSPTTGSQTLKQFSPETLDDRFYVYNTALNAYSNYTSASGVFGGNPNAVAFIRAKGYLIRMPNGLPQEGTSVFNGIFTGTPNNGDITIPLGTGGNRFNAVGNPYPSPINAWEFIDTNEGQLDNGTLYFWRKTNNASATTYATMTKLAYNANDAAGGELAGTFTGQPSAWVINGGQGFFVKAAANATALSFDNSMRRAENNNQFFRTANTDTGTSEISRYWLDITGSEGTFGQATVGYTNVTTNNLDYGWDGRFLNDGAISVYSLSGATKLAIQAREPFTQADIVPLGFKVTAAGNYTLSLSQQDGLFAQGQAIYLKDNLLGITHSLTGAGYPFASEAGTFEGRFEVVYTDNTLGSETPVVDRNSIVIYQKDKAIHISSGKAVIDTIRIYDTQGRLVYERKKVNAAETIISNLAVQQQMLIVQVTTTENNTVSKKIIY